MQEGFQSVLNGKALDLGVLGRLLGVEPINPALVIVDVPGTALAAFLVQPRFRPFQRWFACPPWVTTAEDIVEAPACRDEIVGDGAGQFGLGTAQIPWLFGVNIFSVSI